MKYRINIGVYLEIEASDFEKAEQLGYAVVNELEDAIKTSNPSFFAGLENVEASDAA